MPQGLSQTGIKSTALPLRPPLTPALTTPKVPGILGEWRVPLPLLPDGKDNNRSGCLSELELAPIQ